MKKNWTYKKLGEVCGNSQKINWNKIDIEKQYTYIDLSSVDRESLSIVEPQTIKKTNAPSRAKQIVKTGDVIFATTRPLLRRTCIIEKEYNGQICSTGFCVLRPQKDILTKWIFYNLLYDKFYTYIEPLQTGANYPAIADSVVKDFLIPLPPLPIQEKIVSELDCINGILDNKRQQLKELDALAQSLFYQMFGDPINNEKGWEVKQLGEVVDEKCPISYGIVQPMDNVEDGIPIVRPVDLTDTFVYRQGLKKTAQEISNSYKRTILRGDEILMCVRGTTGVVSLASKELKGCNTTRGIVPLYFAEADRWFMFYLFKNPAMIGVIADNTNGIALKQINIKDVRNLPIITPPLPLQQSFAAKIEAIEKQKELIKQSIADIETLLASRMQYWFD